MTNLNPKKVVVGMSGGVDSSVALLLLQQQGYEVIGLSLKYDIWDDPANELKENVCCSDESFEIARHVCEVLGCEYHIIDTSKEFEKEVVDYLKAELKEKRTPNPCVRCNRVLKFKELLEFADKIGAKYVATGHYARINKNLRTGEYELFKGKDKNKDQTYSLSFLKKESLGRLLLPLGEYTKEEIYKIAEKEGFGFYLKRKQSQDFCFVSQKAFKTFLEKEVGIEPGEIVNEKGKKVGSHPGLHFFTVGQRKGIDVPNGPHFVTGADAQKNILYITNNEESPYLFKNTLILSPVNFLMETPKEPQQVEAKIRYQQSLSPAVIHPAKNGKIKIVFEKPQRAVTKGQFAVFYQGERCLGSGRIMEAE